MSVVHKFYIGNDMDVELPSLQIRQTEAHVTDATVSAQLYETDDFSWDGSALDGTAVGGEVSLSYVAGTDSRYVGSIASTVGVAENAYYKLVVTASKDGRDAMWVFDVQAVFRGPADKQ